MHFAQAARSQREECKVARRYLVVSCSCCDCLHTGPNPRQLRNHIYAKPLLVRLGCTSRLSITIPTVCCVVLDNLCVAQRYSAVRPSCPMSHRALVHTECTLCSVTLPALDACNASLHPPRSAAAQEPLRLSRPDCLCITSPEYAYMIVHEAST